MELEPDSACCVTWTIRRCPSSGPRSRDWRTDDLSFFASINFLSFICMHLWPKTPRRICLFSRSTSKMTPRIASLSLVAAQNPVRFRVVPRLPWLKIFLSNPLEIILAIVIYELFIELDACPLREPERPNAPFCATSMKACSSYNTMILLTSGQIPWWIGAFAPCAKFRAIRGKAGDVRGSIEAVALGSSEIRLQMSVSKPCGPPRRNTAKTSHAQHPDSTDSCASPSSLLTQYNYLD